MRASQADAEIVSFLAMLQAWRSVLAAIIEPTLRVLEAMRAQLLVYVELPRSLEGQHFGLFAKRRQPKYLTGRALDRLAGIE
jgi:hypothetical protein